jgi:GT2 family glycosyltransferase
MDDDVIIHQHGWADEMEEAIRREPQIGIVGLKRKDLQERPDHEERQFQSVLMMLPHAPGERWVVVERVKHLMGTCQMYNSALLDKIGYLYQPSLYGYDDTLASYRSQLAGFINVFLPHIPIDHIDPGGTPYQHWKEKDAGENAQLVSDIVDEYIAGTRSIYYEA